MAKVDLLGGLLAKQRMYAYAEQLSLSETSQWTADGNHSSSTQQQEGDNHSHQLQTIASSCFHTAHQQQQFGSKDKPPHGLLQSDGLAKADSYPAITQVLQRKDIILQLQTQCSTGRNGGSTGSTRAAGSNTAISRHPSTARPITCSLHSVDAVCKACSPIKWSGLSQPPVRQAGSSSTAYAVEFGRIRRWKQQRHRAASIIQAAVRSWLASQQTKQQHICQQLQHSKLLLTLHAWQHQVARRRARIDKIQSWRCSFLAVNPWHAQAWGFHARNMLQDEGWSGFGAAYHKWRVMAAVLIGWAEVCLT